MNFAATVVLPLLMSAAPLTSATGAAIGAPRVREVKLARVGLATTPPTIDGRLDDAVWGEAPAFDDFVERSPVLRGAPVEHTAFRLLADNDALYVGVWCDDSQPAAVRGRTTERDAMALFDDDAVSVKIDPTRSRRALLGFVLNAAGGRMDYRALEDTVWQIEVDLVWEGAVARTDGGWTAELRIPWTTLGVDPASAPPVSGFDLTRDHSRLHATYDWALIAPPHQPIAASQLGALEGLPAVLARARPASSRATWALLPWALAGFDQPGGEDARFVGDAGLDVEADLGGGFAGTLTLNTDFAQVEVDDVTTNLDRFDLFLPEKRDFFLRDGDLFNFGESGWASLFHSRTVGLTAQDEATELPILAGVKVGGRTPGGLRLGALSVLTRPAHDVPWRLDSVLRVQQAFDNGSALGVMGTWRQPLEGDGGRNIAAGVDGTWSDEGDPLLVRTFLATTIDDPAPVAGDDIARDAVVDIAGHLDVRWRGELVRPRLGYAWFGPRLRPALGYFERTGIQNAYGELAVVPRLGALGIETLTLAATGAVVLTAPGSDLLDWSSEAGAQLDWEAGYWLGVFGGVGELTVEEDFTLGADHAVLAGVHRQDRVQIEAGTPTTEAVSAQVSVERRAFFGGGAWTLTGSFVARPGTWLRAQLDAQAAFIALPVPDAGDDAFVAPTMNLRLSSGLTRDLELAMFAGWSGLEDAVSLQARLRWTFAPGDDLFAVWELRLDDETGVASHHSFIAKVALRLP
ncbi:MAG: carbohydrate binding family 9 domain-containing protein [Myxococcales bacterium]|nr:carbohydrate binding family 9 domain-containing protein [Myxococcales bacterium]